MQGGPLHPRIKAASLVEQGVEHLVCKCCRDHVQHDLHELLALVLAPVLAPVPHQGQGPERNVARGLAAEGPVEDLRGDEQLRETRRRRCGDSGRSFSFDYLLRDAQERRRGCEAARRPGLGGGAESYSYKQV